MRIGALLMLPWLFVAAAHADDAEVALSTHSAQFTYFHPTGLTKLGNGDLSAGLFFNDDTDLLAHGGLLVSGPPAGPSPFNFGLGGRVYAAALDDANESILALALGGKATYTIPARTPINLSLEGFFAPDITLAGDANNLIDLVPRVEVEFIPSSFVFFGYRLLQVDLEQGGDAELDDNFHIGLRLHF